MNFFVNSFRILTILLFTFQEQSTPAEKKINSDASIYIWWDENFESISLTGVL